MILLIIFTNTSYKLNVKRGSGISRKNNFNIPATTCGDVEDVKIPVLPKYNNVLIKKY